MTMRFLLTIPAAALLMSVAPLQAHAQPTRPARSASSRVVVLANGDNRVDLLGNATKSNVFVAWRSNNNAHGSSSVAFYLRAPSDVGDDRDLWQVVPFFGGAHDRQTGSELYLTVEGADCTLGDIRLIAHEHSPVEVVTATRELDKSFADPAAVRFDYYALVKNVDGTPGWPTYYFKYVRTVAAKRDYCDVNLAFDRELGLGERGLGHGEGGR